MYVPYSTSLSILNSLGDFFLIISVSGRGEYSSSQSIFLDFLKIKSNQLCMYLLIGDLRTIIIQKFTLLRVTQVPRTTISMVYFQNRELFAIFAIIVSKTLKATHLFIHIYIYVHIYILVYFLSVCWEDLKSITHSSNKQSWAKFLLFKCHSYFNEPKILQRNGWFQECFRKSAGWAWRILLCQKVRKYRNNHGDLAKDHRNQLEGTPLAKSETNWATN